MIKHAETWNRYVPSAADPDGSAPPAMRIHKTEHRGRFELSFAASDEQSFMPQRWAIRVHVPAEDADVETAQLWCGEGDAGSNIQVELYAHMPSRLHSVPFVGRHAPPNAPNAVLEGSLLVQASSSTICTFTIH